MEIEYLRKLNYVQVSQLFLSKIVEGADRIMQQVLFIG